MLVVIPARAGSKRVPKKALRLLGKHPLLAYTIQSALDLYSGPCDPMVDRIIVASEDDEILDCARYYGADTWRRPLATASDDAPDITWLRPFVEQYCGVLQAFMLRRLTSPFITTSVMLRAWDDFLAVPDATALRAMRPAAEHPLKMWARRGVWMTPIVDVPEGVGIAGVEAWSTPTQLLPRVYAQTAGLEILRAETIRGGSLTGERLLPFILDDEQGFDINTPHDWWIAEQLIAADAAALPRIETTPWVTHD